MNHWKTKLKFIVSVFSISNKLRTPISWRWSILHAVKTTGDLGTWANIKSNSCKWNANAMWIIFPQTHFRPFEAILRLGFASFFPPFFCSRFVYTQLPIHLLNRLLWNVFRIYWPIYLCPSAVYVLLYVRTKQIVIPWQRCVQK